LIGKTVRLKEVAEVIAGQSPSGDNYNKEGHGTPFYQGKKDYGEKYLNTPTVWTRKVTKLAHKNDIILSVRAPVGALNISTQKICIGRGLAAIRVKKAVLNDYLYYFLMATADKLDGTVGAIFNSINKKQIEDIILPLPSLAEQRRIVAKLDASFAEIDKIKKLDEIKLRSNNFLIQSYLDNIFESNSNLLKLSDCCEINPAKKEVNDLDDATEVSFMPMKDMGINNKLAIPNQKRKLKDVKGSYTYFSEGDILLAKITPCFENGKMGIASNLLNGIGFGSSEYIVFRPNKNLKNDWLYYFLNRNSFRIDGSRNMSGAVGHKRVNKDFIGNTLIPIPSLEEQEKILFTLTNLSNHSKAINKIILKKKMK